MLFSSNEFHRSSFGKFHVDDIILRLDPPARTAISPAQKHQIFLQFMNAVRVTPADVARVMDETQPQKNDNWYV